MIATHTDRSMFVQDTVSLKSVWQNIDANSCPKFYNFHMHTVCSDGRLTPQALMSQAVEIGLQGLAITDHHTIQGYYQAQTWLEIQQRQQPDKSFPHLWTGIEITSDLQGVEVHILGYDFNPRNSHLQTYLTGEKPSWETAKAERVIDTIHQAGGLVILAHPSRYRRPMEELVPLAVALGIDGIEAYYAYDNPNPWRTSIQPTEQAKNLAKKYTLFTTCGTDTHGLNLLRRI
ncbi:MAG: PHP domain-containing protein [Cyanobacteria bacterium J083]|nr:MAG: PHP domain-containing protein [Cyanobacteria bacterium J083]